MSIWSTYQKYARSLRKLLRDASVVQAAVQSIDDVRGLQALLRYHLEYGLSNSHQAVQGTKGEAGMRVGACGTASVP